MTLPNFLVIGAAKAGTTSLYFYLKEHPSVFMPSVKEPRFFAYDENNPEYLQIASANPPISNLKKYEALFDGVTDESAVGEASPEYLNSAISAARIQALIPHVRLVASLRNPVDRAYSAYLFRVRIGKEKRSADRALRSGERWVRTGLYYQGIKRYMDRFDSKQIKVILFEELSNDPLKIIGELFRFLEVDDTFTPNLQTQYNPSGVPKSWILNALLTNRQIYNKFEQHIPVLPGALRSLARRAKRVNLSRPPLSMALRKELLIFFRDDILRLQDLLQRDLSSWLSEDPGEQGNSMRTHTANLA